ncbi:MAG: glycoside hydrolase family 127 protein [Prevotella sp.]|nr:glycoside hydrolase family 127 protein [Prevotella sp.]
MEKPSTTQHSHRPAFHLLYALGLFASIFLSCHAPAKAQTARMTLRGAMGERYEANLQNWLLQAPFANPGMTEMYFRRNASHQPIVPWYGEFSGKYLTSAALAYAMQPDERLRQAVDYVVGRLAEAQDSDGYLGVWSDEKKLAGMAPGHGKTWDVWAHYHNMLGLFYWYKATHDEQALQVLRKAADCLYQYFCVNGHDLDEAKDGTDAAVGHIFALLYNHCSREERYMKMVEKTLHTFASEQGGDYFRSGLEGVPFYKMKRRRWECLHAVETIREMYDISGDETYRKAFENIWRSIAEYDRHNTGGFSSGEAACGNPYDTRAIETCCTIAWMALTIDMLSLTHDPKVADELELSTWNAFLGAQHPSGRSFTYNTPMLGDKKASAHDIVFQSVAGSPELNCCSVNGPRGFGMIGQWAVTSNDKILTVNYYGESSTTIDHDGGEVSVLQTGNYPFDKDIHLQFSTGKAIKTLCLRIPAWSKETILTLNGKPMKDVCAGTYYTMHDIRDNDQIDISFDFSLHYWQGDRELHGRTAIYLGPILLTCDQRFEPLTTDSLPSLELSSIETEPLDPSACPWPQPYLLVKATDSKGHQLTLCDFASAGQAGTSYTSWLPTLPLLPVSTGIMQWKDRLPVQEQQGKRITLSKTVLKDKIRGGWAGQTIGCAYGGPTEFCYRGIMIDDSINIAYPEHHLQYFYDKVPGLYDDIYMDLTFVDVFNRLGLDAPVDSFATAFAYAKYPLWHANQAGRYNIQQGIMPPSSGYWKNNPHADCIDYQIESDYAGLMTPGMPNEASRISDKIGHIMNYGDGWYGGIFVGAMYSLSFVYSNIETIVTQALKTIPQRSKFHQCLSDVLKWYHEDPKDWKRAWRLYNEKWAEDVGCPELTIEPGNIDATMNSAYVAIGLLYGHGDFGRTLEIATRCGQDSDCNPSTAGGILATMMGYSHLPESWMPNLREVEDRNLAYTDMSLSKATDIVYRLALEEVERNGGTVDDETVTIKIQQPRAVRLEQGFTGLHPFLLDKDRELTSATLSFDGHAIAVYGQVSCADKDYEAQLEVTVDGHIDRIMTLPVAFLRRSADAIYWNYDLEKGHHTVTFRLLNPHEDAKINARKIIAYN